MSQKELLNFHDSPNLNPSLTHKVLGFVNNSIRQATEKFSRPDDPDLNASNESFSDMKFQSTGEMSFTNSTSASVAIPTILNDSMATSCSPMSLASISTSAGSPTVGCFIDQESGHDPDNLPIISLQEVQDHDSPRDAWMVIYDVVYNFTTFIDEHPGGYDVMMDYVGYDGTWAFRGTGHSKRALEMMKPYRIGILPETQRLYSNKMQW